MPRHPPCTLLELGHALPAPPHTRRAIEGTDQLSLFFQCRVAVRTRMSDGEDGEVPPACTRGRGGRFNSVGQATTHPARCVSTPGPVAEKVPDDTPRPTEDRLTACTAPDFGSPARHTRLAF